jgi:hypothetical protein
MKCAARVTGDLFRALCAAAGLPAPVAEYRFAPPRRYKFDFAWPAERLALEVEGGIYGIGPPDPFTGRRRVAGHTSIDRLKRDMAKYNLAAVLGYRLLRCTAEEFTRGDAVGLVGRAFAAMRGTDHGKA